MKNRNSKITLLFILALAFMSFTTLTKKEVNIEKSKVNWIGYKVTGQHEGNISLKSGSLIFDDETLTGGAFVIDMGTINTTDLEGESKSNLDGHLKSDDFFGVEAFPTATLTITGVSGSKGSYKVKANINIKGISEAVEFPMTIEGNTATAALKIDRTKHKITYKSPSFFESLKDKAINDEFDLNVTLAF